jgi:hypothetical protein
MRKLEKLREDPMRTNRLSEKDSFYDSAGLNPIYVDTDRGLVDVSTLCSFISLHQGSRLDDEFSAMLSYLKSSNLRHPVDDSAIVYSNALNQAKHDPEHLGHGHYWYPFFVHPVTAYFFARWHLRKSPQLYNMPLEPNSNLFSPVLRKMIIDGLEELKRKSSLVYYMAMHDVSFSLKTCAKEAEEGYEFSIDVIIRIGSDKYHEVIDLPGNEFSGSFEDIVSNEKVARHLKGLNFEDRL